MKLRSYFLSCVLFCNLSAEVSITYINGFSDIFTYEINPVVGAVLWKTKVIENLYRVTSGDNNVLSNSAIGRLVHSLFYLQPDNVTFDCTSAPNKIESSCDEKMVATALAFIEREKIYLNEKNKKEFIEELQNAFVIYFRLKIENKTQKLEKEITSLKKTLNENIQKEIDKKEEEIKKNNTLKDDKKTLSNKFSELSKNITGALLESSEPNAWYEENLINGILLAWLWKKSDERVSLIPNDKGLYARQYFYDFAVAFEEEYKKESIRVTEELKKDQKKLDSRKIAMGKTQKEENKEKILIEIKKLEKIIEEKKKPRLELIKNKNFLDASTKSYKEFITKKSFTKNDYENNKKDLNLMHLNNDLSYEKAAINFLGFQLFENHYPPYIGGTSYANVTINGKEKIFSDCGETSLRNFINCLIFNAETQTFNVDLLQKIGAKQLVIDFYKEYNGIEKIELQKCYNAWAQICSNIPDVVYKDDFCNIRGIGANNIVKVLAYFLGISYTSVNQVFKDLKSNLSKQNITLDWEGNDVISDGFGEKTFSVDNKIKFKWFFKDGHFVVEFTSKNFKPQDNFLKNDISALSNWFFTKRYVIFVSDDNVKKEFISKICSNEIHKEPLLKVSSLLAYMKNEEEIFFLFEQIVQIEKPKEVYKILMKNACSFFNSADSISAFGQKITLAKNPEDWYDLLKKIIYDLRNNPEDQGDFFALTGEIYWGKKSTQKLFEIILPYLKNCFMANNWRFNRQWYAIITRLFEYNFPQYCQYIIDFLCLPNLMFRLHDAVKDGNLNKDKFLTMLKDNIDSQSKKSFNFENLYKEILSWENPKNLVGYWHCFDIVINGKYKGLYKPLYDFLKEFKHFRKDDITNKIPEKYLKLLEEKLKETEVASVNVDPLSQSLLLLKSKLLSLAVQLK